MRVWRSAGKCFRHLCGFHVNKTRNGTRKRRSASCSRIVSGGARWHNPFTRQPSLVRLAHGFALSRLQRALAHLDLAVNSPAFVQFDPARANLAFDQTRGLQLEPALGDDGARNPAADHGILGRDIAEHNAVFTDHHGFAGANSAFDRALDP